MYAVGCNLVLLFKRSHDNIRVVSNIRENMYGKQTFNARILPSNSIPTLGWKLVNSYFTFTEYLLASIPLINVAHRVD